MKHLLASFCTLTLAHFLAATTAHAQYRTFVNGDAGFYWRADVGAAIPEDGHLTEFGGFHSGQDVKYDVGIALDLAGGYAFNRMFATELQVGWTWNSIDSIENTYSDNSSFGTVPIFANVVLQLPIPRTVVVPYLGAGAGGAATFFDTDELFFRGPGGAVSLYGGESDFVFAWQAMAGVRFALSDQMSVGVGYRYLYVDESSYSYDSAFHGGPDLELGLSKHQSHTIAVTFQMRF